MKYTKMHSKNFVLQYSKNAAYFIYFLQFLYVILVNQFKAQRKLIKDTD